jgi:hypothetical protein
MVLDYKYKIGKMLIGKYMHDAERQYNMPPYLPNFGGKYM